jgi:hypothetical protein
MCTIAANRRKTIVMRRTGPAHEALLSSGSSFPRRRSTDISPYVLTGASYRNHCIKAEKSHSDCAKSESINRRDMPNQGATAMNPNELPYLIRTGLVISFGGAATPRCVSRSTTIRTSSINTSWRGTAGLRRAGQCADRELYELDGLDRGPQ